MVEELHQQMERLMTVYLQMLECETESVDSEKYQKTWDQLDALKKRRDDLLKSDTSKETKQMVAEFQTKVDTWCDRFDKLVPQVKKRIDTAKFILQARFNHDTIMGIYQDLIRSYETKSDDGTKHFTFWLDRFQQDREKFRTEAKEFQQQDLIYEFDAKIAKMAQTLQQIKN